MGIVWDAIKEIFTGEEIKYIKEKKIAEKVDPYKNEKQMGWLWLIVGVICVIYSNYQGIVFIILGSGYLFYRSKNMNLIGGILFILEGSWSLLLYLATLSVYDGEPTFFSKIIGWTFIVMIIIGIQEINKFRKNKS